MLSFLYLALAIVAELFGSSLLKASEGFSKLYSTIVLIVAFVTYFFFLSLSLKTIPLSTAYALWSGIGLVCTTIISVLIWKGKINVASVAGILLIVAGVVILNMFDPGHGIGSKSKRTGRSSWKNGMKDMESIMPSIHPLWCVRWDSCSL